MAKLTAQFHIAFNVVLAVAFIGLLDPLAWLLTKMFPARAKAENPSAPRYLDESDLGSPSLALADAARETLRMGDIVEVMLRQVMKALMNGDRALVAEVSRMDNVVDKLDESIKLYVTKLTRESLDENEGKRAMEIISFAINLEHIGDIIDKNLSEIAAKKIKRQHRILSRGGSRARGIPQAHPRQPAARLQRFHVERRRRRPQADRRKGPDPQRGARGRRASL